MRIPGLWTATNLYNKKVEDLNTLKMDIRRSETWGIIRYTAWKVFNKKFLKGVNIVGFAKGDFGLAEHTRLVTNSIKKTEVKFCVHDSGDTGKHSAMNNELNEYLSEETLYSINIFTFNSDSIINYFQGNYFKKDRLFLLKNQYNIGYGYWELSIYPAKWQLQDKHLNEIWAPSKFIKEVIDKYSKLPVYYMPIAVDFKIPVGYTRSQFNLPENSLLYLFTFDLSSLSTRKNPQAVVTAFCSAFPVDKNEQVSLIIKINRIHSDKEQALKIQELSQRIAFDPRIQIIDEVLDRNSILGLIQVCDCYVSLHRAEGFGLGMAEAMKMGKVVIATDYSGNKDFMNEENSCPVKYTLIPVIKEEYVNVEEGAVWAEPDIDHAAYYMKKVYDDKEYAKKKGEAAKSYMDTHHNFETIGKGYQKRLLDILNSKN